MKIEFPVSLDFRNQLLCCEQCSQQELKTANDEMHLGYEEFTTSEEVMQWLNEELPTVNSELQGKLG